MIVSARRYQNNTYLNFYHFHFRHSTQHYRHEISFLIYVSKPLIDVAQSHFTEHGGIRACLLTTVPTTKGLRRALKRNVIFIMIQNSKFNNKIDLLTVRVEVTAIYGKRFSHKIS